MKNNDKKIKCKWLTSNESCRMNICMLKRAFIDVLYEIELDPNFAAFSEVAHIMDDSCQYSHNCGFCSRINSKLGDDFNKLTELSMNYAYKKFNAMTKDELIELFNELKAKIINGLREQQTHLENEITYIDRLSILTN